MANAQKIKGPYILGFPASHALLPEGNWLVVSTPLKNMNQLGLFFPTYDMDRKCSKPPTSYPHVSCLDPPLSGQTLLNLPGDIAMEILC